MRRELGAAQLAALRGHALADEPTKSREHERWSSCQPGGDRDAQHSRLLEEWERFDAEVRADAGAGTADVVSTGARVTHQHGTVEGCGLHATVTCRTLRHVRVEHVAGSRDQDGVAVGDWS